MRQIPTDPISFNGHSYSLQQITKNDSESPYSETCLWGCVFVLVLVEVGLSRRLFSRVSFLFTSVGTIVSTAQHLLMAFAPAFVVSVRYAVDTQSSNCAIRVGITLHQVNNSDMSHLRSEATRKRQVQVRGHFDECLERGVLSSLDVQFHVTFTFQLLLLLRRP